MGNKKGTFKKGDPRINRTGRPKKGQTLTDILKEFGNKKEVEINGKKYTRNEALSIILWDKAIRERDRKSIEYIYNRIDGSPVQAIDGDINIKGNIGITMADLHQEADEWEAEQEKKNKK